MTIYQHIYNNLLKHSWMRYDRHEAIREMLKEKYDVVGWENLPDVAHDWLSYDRVFRKVLEEHPELQGDGYEQRKKVLEQSFELDLGYEPNYYDNQKKLRNL